MDIAVLDVSALDAIDVHVHVEQDGTALLYIDRHLVHEVTSPQAFIVGPA